MKLKETITFSNCLFVYDHIKDLLPQNFNDYFKTADKQHNYNTRGSKNKKVFKPTINTTSYGLNSIKYRAATSWNDFTNHIDMNDGTLTKGRFIKLLKEKINCI